MPYLYFGESMTKNKNLKSILTKPTIGMAATGCMILLTSCTSTPTERPPIQIIQPTPIQKSPSKTAKKPALPPVVVIEQQKSISQPTQPLILPSSKPDVLLKTTKNYDNFNDWQSDFISRSTAQTGTLNHLMTNAHLNQRVLNLDKNQAEFSKMPWEYVDSAVSNNRIQQGRSKLRENLALLSSVQNTYGVPKEIVMAIWGMESSYGAGTGSMDLVNALSSLAYDGRRRSFAEEQLLAMSQMIERGDVTLSQLKGSWAGGMGHTQFIPSTWLKEAIDGDGDGRKNPWNISDALSSTASYLSNSGWVRNLPAFYEVRLPANFDYQLLFRQGSLDFWRQVGLNTVGGEILSGSHQAQLWLPAGKNGPALLLTKNFNVIKVYNNSSSYALGVALLAKRIEGGSSLVQSWPRHEQPLSRTQVQNLQRNLTAQGYDTGGVDGIAGANTRRAFAQWQADNGQVPDGFISQNTAKNLIW